jgi:hypothetical protein
LGAKKRTITTARKMIRVGAFALIFLAAGVVAATASGRHSAAPNAARCGGQLWRLKTFSDQQRMKVDLNTQQTTIAAIRALHGPGRPPTRRKTAFQLHVWEVPAQVTSFRSDSTGSLRLILYDHEAYMNAVIPSPSCLPATTRDRAEIVAAWHLFVEKCGKATSSWQSLGAIFFVRGVGFWSQRVLGRGTAPNGAELHAVTGLRIVAGC